MLFSSSLVAASMMLSRVCNALPQPEDGGLTGRAATSSCARGSYLVTDFVTTCQPCPAGSYCSDGKTKQPCNPGYYQPSTNTTACIPAPPGSFQNATNATASIPCAAGSYQPKSAQTSCPVCPTGSYQSNVNTTACIITPAGYFNNATNATAPIACPQGGYQSKTGQTSCQQCPSGTFQSSIGATSYSNCTDTPRGTYAPNAGTPYAIPCAPGTATNGTRQVGCNGCSSGRFQQYSGMTFCCGTCSGWQAKLVNNNIQAVECTNATAPYAYPNSGDGCIAKNTGLAHAATCMQDSTTGTCPADTFNP